jgi:hypothetical protein
MRTGVCPMAQCKPCTLHRTWVDCFSRPQKLALNTIAMMAMVSLVVGSAVLCIAQVVLPHTWSHVSRRPELVSSPAAFILLRTAAALASAS